MPKVAMIVTFDRKEIDNALETAAKASMGKTPAGTVKIHYLCENVKNVPPDAVTGAVVEFCGVGGRADKGNQIGSLCGKPSKEELGGQSQ